MARARDITAIEIDVADLSAKDLILILIAKLLTEMLSSIGKEKTDLNIPLGVRIYFKALYLARGKPMSSFFKNHISCKRRGVWERLLVCRSICILNRREFCLSAHTENSKTTLFNSWQEIVQEKLKFPSILDVGSNLGTTGWLKVGDFLESSVIEADRIFSFGPFSASNLEQKFALNHKVQDVTLIEPESSICESFSCHGFGKFRIFDNVVLAITLTDHANLL
jgi:hypothetical protein